MFTHRSPEGSLGTGPDWPTASWLRGTKQKAGAWRTRRCELITNLAHSLHSAELIIIFVVRVSVRARPKPARASRPVIEPPRRRINSISNHDGVVRAGRRTPLMSMTNIDCDRRQSCSVGATH